MKKTNGDIIILHMSIKKHDQMMYVPEIWCKTNGQTGRQTDRQADRQKWHTEVGAHLKTKENRTLSSLLLMTIDKKAF